LVENQFHPPHEHHGLVKYDAGGTILALNLFADRKFRTAGSDAATLVCRHAGLALGRLSRYGHRAGDRFTDVDGHHYVVRAVPPADPTLATDVCAVRLAVPDLAAALAFYRDVLGLPVLDTAPGLVRFGTGSLDLVVYASPTSVDGQPLRHNACLLVFYTGDVEFTQERLRGRGLRFVSSAAFSDIGGTARFRDPSGHTFCLYQPSAESLTWGSGEKVRELMLRTGSAG